MREPVVAYFDGLCERDPATGKRNPGGIACGGWVVTAHAECAGLERPVEGSQMYACGAGATNNVAEYRAALSALRSVYRAGWRGPVVLYGDSKLVVEQYNGRWACNSRALADLRAQLRHAATFFASVQVRWVPRESNERADHLSRQAYYAALRAQRRRLPAMDDDDDVRAASADADLMDAGSRR